MTETQAQEVDVIVPDKVEAGAGREIAERADGTAVAQTPTTTPADLLRMAVKQNADLEKLEKLMDLQDRWEANEARKAYVAAMAAFKAEPPTLIKNKHVEYGEGSKKTEYDHVTLDQVSTVVGAALSCHGLSHDWEIDQPEGGAIIVTCTITHVLGHSKNAVMKAGADQSGGKNSIQAIASTVSYLERYTLLAATGLAAKDQDDDGGGVVEMISGDQKDKLIALMKEVGADTAKFLQYLGIEYIDVLPASRFNSAVQALEAKKRKAPENEGAE